MSLSSGTRETCHGELPEPVENKIKFLDRLICNRLNSLKQQGFTEFEDDLRLWLDTRTWRTIAQSIDMLFILSTIYFLQSCIYCIRGFSLNNFSINTIKTCRNLNNVLQKFRYDRFPTTNLQNFDKKLCKKLEENFLNKKIVR